MGGKGCVNTFRVSAKSPVWKVGQSGVQQSGHIGFYPEQNSSAKIFSIWDFDFYPKLSIIILQNVGSFLPQEKGPGNNRERGRESCQIIMKHSYEDYHPLTHSFLTAKQLFPGFLHFSMLF